ncbi:tripartite tricarboxylate transporter TctB family protein [Mesorhizobium sp. ESP7-2]|uniref:tripartite tricarboxylate transporter TctB family protein n=1 Tax=unclassified Mesorhizobium TaxID=325217 RepID=UPI001CCF9EF9|nr:MULTISPECIES: tripartite tricarboxylate transporter TctB family protein [unclassified Mesorhizobium]MBZ9668501.1 tripartite tricarboxylate transporter TctB family protein [Mesorhizobium sp. ES1-3]MBZ9708860.1 tripartite tricarboxylate transporter TctB family protein [Mesorhizobium sp. ESP7-2]
MSSLTHVTINFETSHLVFPGVIGAILAILGLAIVVTRRRSIAGSGAYWRGIVSQMDKMRFFGAIGLCFIYFALLEPVGELMPNTGFGFLACSIPFVLLTSLLFMHQRNLRTVLPVVMMAAIAPVLTWWLFNDVFFLSLP